MSRKTQHRYLSHSSKKLLRRSSSQLRGINLLAEQQLQASIGILAPRDLGIGLGAKVDFPGLATIRPQPSDSKCHTLTLFLVWSKVSC